jgi:hypothetical protein
MVETTFDLKLSSLELLLPVMIPVLVSLLVRLFRRLPKWTIPVLLVPGLSLTGQWAYSVLANEAASPVSGLLLAGLAVLVREVSDQLSKAGKAVTGGLEVPRVGGSDSTFDLPPNFLRRPRGRQR